MMELVRYGAIKRQAEGREVRYFMNAPFVTAPPDGSESDRLSLMPRETGLGVPWTPAGSTPTGLSLKRLVIRSLGI